FGDNNTTSTYDGVFTSAAGATLNVRKIGSGAATFTNGSVGNFTGTTTVAGGSLVLAATVGHTANLATSGTGSLDVTAFGTGGFALTTNQTLTSNGSVAGNINVGSGVI